LPFSRDLFIKTTVGSNSGYSGSIDGQNNFKSFIRDDFKKKGIFPSLFKLKIPTIPLWIMCIFRRKDGLEMQGKLVSTESKNTVLDYELLKIFQCLYITKMKEEK
jgi:hypothetical protein